MIRCSTRFTDKLLLSREIAELCLVSDLGRGLAEMFTRVARKELEDLLEILQDIFFARLSRWLSMDKYKVEKLLIHTGYTTVLYHGNHPGLVSYKFSRKIHRRLVGLFGARVIVKFNAEYSYVQAMGRYDLTERERKRKDQGVYSEPREIPQNVVPYMDVSVFSVMVG